MAPLEIRFHGPAGEVLVHGATGEAVRLPLTRSNTAGTYTIDISEMLSEKTTKMTLEVGAAQAADVAITPEDSDSLQRFCTEKYFIGDRLDCRAVLRCAD